MSGKFPPSEHKLRKLRQSGIVPFSYEVISAGALVGAVVSFLFMLYAYGERILAVCRGLFSGIDAQNFALKEWKTTVFSAIVPVAAIVFVCVVFVGILQTHFLFRSVFSARVPSIREKHRGAILMILATLVLLSVGAVCLFIGYSLNYDEGLITLLSDIDKGANYDIPISSFIGSKLELFQNWVILVVGVTLAGVLTIAAISRFYVVAMFRNTHGMSREELQAEYRETEMSPEIKRAIRNRFR